MKIIKLYEELFQSDNVYDIVLDSFKEYDNKKYGYGNDYDYRYSFITKDDVKYRVMLFINSAGNTDVNFDTIGLNDKNHSSIIELINTGDSIKVFNTIKTIIYKHKDKIKKLIIGSTSDRIVFYKKLLDYMKIKNELHGSQRLIGYLQ